jgi:hypothetical protein
MSVTLPGRAAVVFHAKAGEARHFPGWHCGKTVQKPSRWAVDELPEEMARLA